MKQEQKTDKSKVVKTGAFDGLSSTIVNIEASFTRGCNGVHIVGNVTESCRDGKDRAKTALEKLDVTLPDKRIIINFSPADIKKTGNHFDLPIAISFLQLAQTQPFRIDLKHWLFTAELGLKGQLRPVKGVVSFAIKAAEQGLAGMVVSEQNARELRTFTKLSSSKLKNLTILSFQNLKQIVHWLQSGYEQPLETQSKEAPLRNEAKSFDDMILSPEQTKLICTIAAGMHSALLRGSPGTGKSMLAARLPSILPKMEPQEHIDALQIKSLVSESLPIELLEGFPPFRSPHHQSSSSAILGTADAPGELALAHGGVLFLDEFPEFRKDLIEALREPLQTGTVDISRAQKKVRWKTSSLLIAACNNCPCGWAGSKKRLCACTTQKHINYSLRLSGPILDRIDIHFPMPEPKVPAAKMLVDLSSQAKSHQTEQLIHSVVEARAKAKKRNLKLSNNQFNRDIRSRDLLKASGLDESSFSKLLEKYSKPENSTRAIVKALRVARTLADIDNSESIREENMATAMTWQSRKTI